MTGSLLSEIIERKEQAVRLSKRTEPLAGLKALAAAQPAPRKFGAALLKGGGIIAEIKKRSPSGRQFPRAADPAALARVYERGGASAISVLTDEPFFGGSLADLRLVKKNVGIPVLRKDFIIDAYQVWQARACGADAVLLIAAVLTGPQLKKLLALTKKLGMEALLEVHNAAELKTALNLRKAGAPADIIGINTRNLSDLSIDLDLPRRLLPRIPAGPVKVVESGIGTPAQIKKFRGYGAQGFLIGGSLLAAGSPGRKLREFCDASKSKN